jgi:hypothetical protein
MSQQHQVPLDGYAVLGAAGMLFETLWRHGPDWGCVAPILFGCAAVFRTVRDLRKDDDARLIAAEERAAKFRSGTIAGLTFDQLEGRSDS